MSGKKDGNSLLFTYDLKLRSRYSETDQMGYVYHGRMLEYFEQARTEMIRDAGVSYKALEDSGVMLPVSRVEINYKRPVFYDELITVRVKIYDKPSTRLHTYYEVLSESGKVKVTGEVMLVFVDRETRRPCEPPQIFIDGIEKLIRTYEPAG